MKLKAQTALLLVALTASSTSFAQEESNPVGDVLLDLGMCAAENAADAYKENEKRKEKEADAKEREEMKEEIRKLKERNQSGSGQIQTASLFYKEAKSLKSKQDRLDFSSHHLGLEQPFTAEELSIALRTQYGIKRDLANDMAGALLK